MDGDEDEALLLVTQSFDDGITVHPEQGSVNSIWLGITEVLLVVTNPC